MSLFIYKFRKREYNKPKKNTAFCQVCIRESLVPEGTFLAGRSVFLVLIFKCVGLVLGVCGKLLGAVLSLFGFIVSIAIGAVVFGLSTAFALVLLCIAAVWLLIKLIF